MTEITQADKDAANKWIDTTPGIKDWVGYEEEREIAEAFARCREKGAAEERAKIVAWLRSRGQLEDCYSELQDDWLSNRIEAGEHETFTRSDDT